MTVRFLREWVVPVFALAVVVVVVFLVLPQIAMDMTGERGPRSPKSNMMAIKNLLAQFKLDCDRYPTTDEGLEALWRMPPSFAKRWMGPYTDRAIDDPWGRPYLYVSDGKSFTLGCLGADSRPGGKGEDEDVVVRD